MTIAGVLNLLAWVLSAVIAAWLLFDMARVSRQHDERQLTTVAEIDMPFDDLTEQRPGHPGGHQ